MGGTKKARKSAEYKIFSPLLCQLSYLAAKVARAGNMKCRGFCASKFSRAIDFDRLDLATVTMHVDGDWTTTDFAIFDRRKSAG